VNVVTVAAELARLPLVQPANSNAVERDGDTGVPVGEVLVPEGGHRDHVVGPGDADFEFTVDGDEDGGVAQEAAEIGAEGRDVAME
jgi:hypothetical protein